MDFPDLPHIHQLRKDLGNWPNSRAAVMVGAGFSLNAEPLASARMPFPDWRQLSRAMFNDIYPPVPGETAEQKAKREQHFTQKGPLRVASEYEAAFGPQRLESFIRNYIPDGDFQPGRLHELLLQSLPWKDVFTTNYDTLLERTQAHGKAYRLVTKVAGLTTSSSPRIIKLHGSLPSETPFIITEDHYRTYRRRFAPFVNTVQQSLIENCFVLVGFSGDDPNFLEWTGWIRDELGDDHAPIYLVGALSASNVQRSLLQRRGVTPVDLAPLFMGKIPPNGIHAAALEWFLLSLLETEPPRPETWPETKLASNAILDFDPPILAGGWTEPEEVDPHGDPVGPPDDATAVKVFTRWRFDRSRYPGWLVATNEIRSSLWSKTEAWIKRSFVDSIKNWSPADRILCFREINWRMEVSMIPLFPELIEPFEAAVDELFAGIEDQAPEEPSDKIKGSTHIAHAEVAEAWLEVTFALLREARENYDAKRWAMFWDKISAVVKKYPQFADQYHYEQVLWMVWNIERDHAKEALTKWSPSPYAPIAVIRKAGLLAELDELGDARSLLQAALQEIRKSLHSAEGRNIGALSVEGWCMYLLLSVEGAIDFRRGIALREEFSKRWRELEVWDCNPWPIFRHFDAVLSDTPPVRKEGLQVAQGFDPGHRKRTYYFGTGLFSARLPAFACIRLYEQAGIPPRFRAGDSLRNACKWVSPFLGFWSPALLIRAGKAEWLTEHGFTDRSQIAAMDSTLAQDLSRWAMEALKRELLSLGRNSRIMLQQAQVHLLEALTEVLSRLSFRLDSGALQESFRLAVDYFSRSEIRYDLRLRDSYRSWFRRLFMASDDEQMLTWLPELLRLPLYETNDRPRVDHPRHWPDPVADYPVNWARSAKEDFPQLLPAASDAIQWLLERARSETGEGRRRAIIRLIQVCVAGLMSNEQQESLGDLIWEKTGANNLPNVPDFPCFYYLQLPAPARIEVASLIKEHIWGLAIGHFRSNEAAEDTGASEATNRESFFDLLAYASKPVVQLPEQITGLIEWNPEERREFWAIAIKWWKKNRVLLNVEKRNFAIGTSSVENAFHHLVTVLARIVFPNMGSATEEEWNEVVAFVSEARQHQCYVTAALPYLLLHRPQALDDVIETICGDLSSGEEKAVKASARAVRHWVHLGAGDHLDYPPTTLVDALIRNVAFRRSPGVQTCMDQLTCLLWEKPDLFRVEQIATIVMSLPSWEAAVHLPLSDGRSAGFPESERPDLRALLGRLISALRLWFKSKLPGQSEPTEICDLMEAFSTDPLPEVRRALNWWKYV